MRISPLVLSAVLLMAACNTKPTTIETAVAPATDTSTVMEVPENVTPPPIEAETKTPAATEKKKTTTKQTSSSNSTATTSTSSESEGAASKKKGWSKTAKGAVVGGVVGAGTGAVVNKKNRAAGAVIGGVIGAGTGAVIGNEMDKKDGRH
jgi:hypothetical protein